MKFTARMICMALMVSLLYPVIGWTQSQQTNEKFKPKVMVFTMFEVGKNSGDVAGEFQHWFEAYFTDAEPIKVIGAYAPVFISKTGICGTIIGQGKSHAAGSLTAILTDPRFDFSKTYFLTSGCSGAPPAFTSLGSVVWADFVVDYDLGHRIARSELKPGQPSFIQMHSYDDFTRFRLNGKLVKWAYALSKNVGLSNSDKAEAYGAHYTEANAGKAPSVSIGTTVCGDCYFHGRVLSAEAAFICKLYNAGEYATAEMEDAAVALVLKNFGYLGRYAIARDVVNFDQPYPGQAAKTSLTASSGGFSIGMENGFKVGSALVNHIVENWEKWEAGVPDMP